ncbi:hypothetical protein Avbf_04380 [Armadillidium vulgare]|nr:hypothetical protein Avbf_04380 [Armadillidium vulgare]
MKFNGNILLFLQRRIVLFGVAANEEERKQREQLELIMEENKRKMEEAQAKLAEQHLKIVEQQRKMDEQRQRLKKEQERRTKEEQKRILGKNNARPKISFSLT